ncbi:DUF4232 domain-containing protein [Streptomyces sp. S.PNR 29]|uniref:DUF4232 domain-containing protein n=1 Tax=Streptomyces sp. S.PNR 29 TaxID=2973805 RepID=UPI0025B0A205|nr:DUF4232 domain-containing protein [Streptomyces sp. S.PNR 29]MDN0197752.1 DUF4232 domain-containing protein [Streptomyces sp. S.PNR 29]
MANTSRSRRRAALLTSSVALLGALTACGTDRAAQQLPATDGRTTGTGGAADQENAAVPSDTAASMAASGHTGDRCHTSQLRAAVGRVDPGAGQRNFPVVLTNASSRTCTLYGYPGAAFVDASGRQLGPDPQRSPGTPETVTLTPGRSAWAGLRFASPEISGARTATPAALLVTPPDERDSLEVKWTAGKVPVGGNASKVFLTPLSPGTGP